MRTTSVPLNSVVALMDVADERRRQNELWGTQSHPDGTGAVPFAAELACARDLLEQAAENEQLTWRHILEEEVWEAFSETDEMKLREELVQVAAVAVAWIESIDGRRAV